MVGLTVCKRGTSEAYGQQRTNEPKPRSGEIMYCALDNLAVLGVVGAAICKLQASFRPSDTFPHKGKIYGYA